MHPELTASCFRTPPRDRLPEGGAGWTISRCVNAVLGRFVLKATHAALFNSGIPPSLRVGRQYPITVHICRAISNTRPRPFSLGPGEPTAEVVESCQFHVGRNIIHGGRCRVWACSERNARLPPASSRGVRFIYPNHPGLWPLDELPTGAFEGLRTHLKPGREYVLMSLQTPRIVEVLYSSRKRYCGIPV